MARFRRMTRFRRRRFGGVRGKPRLTRFGRRRGGRAVWSAIRGINKRLTSEVKKFDTAVTEATIASTGQVFGLTAIAQGDQPSNRTGNQIKLKYLQLFGTMTNADQLANGLRIILLQDTRMVADTAPTVAEILTTASWLSNFEVQNASAGRFNILWNQLILNRVSTTDLELHQIKKFFNLSRLPRPHYNGAATTDIHNNHLFLVVLSQTDQQGGIDLTARVGYYDN